MKARVFSGIQPTGNTHIGNYLGALKNWVKIQHDYESIFCIVDLHAITLYQDPAELRKKIEELAGILLAGRQPLGPGVSLSAGSSKCSTRLDPLSLIGAVLRSPVPVRCSTTFGPGFAFCHSFASSSPRLGTLLRSIHPP